jgi:putative endonuclease
MFFSVYIMTNFTNSFLYIGVTNNLEPRVEEHKAGSGSDFTSKYRIYKLVYFESGDYGLAALAREKQLKGWTRAKKIKLIGSINPDWHNLALEIFE